MKIQKPKKAEQAIRVFRKYCSGKKMRYTPEREIIIREIYALGGHFNVEQLFSEIRRKNPKSTMAKTSIYRSVPFFLDAGLLRESIAEAGQIFYECTLGRFDHDHFRCVGCGAIVEFYSKDLETAQKKICEKEKFKVLWRTNVINGYCQTCLQTNPSEKTISVKSQLKLNT